MSQSQPQIEIQNKKLVHYVSGNNDEFITFKDKAAADNFAKQVARLGFKARQGCLAENVALIPEGDKCLWLLEEQAKALRVRFKAAFDHVFRKNRPNDLFKKEWDQIEFYLIEVPKC